MSYFPRPVREIISEDKLTLVDRMYQPGDLLKRSVDDVRSGIVTGCVLEFIHSFACVLFSACALSWLVWARILTAY